MGRSLGVRGITVKDKKAQVDFLPEHVEQAGTKIIKGLSKALGNTKEKVELMNNKSLTFIMSNPDGELLLTALRNFLEKLHKATTFSD